MRLFSFIIFILIFTSVVAHAQDLNRHPYIELSLDSSTVLSGTNITGIATAKDGSGFVQNDVAIIVKVGNKTTNAVSAQPFTLATNGLTGAAYTVTASTTEKFHDQTYDNGTAQATIFTFNIDSPVGTTDGDDSNAFSISIQPQTLAMTEFSWSFVAPDGAGNNPQVSFSSANTGNTIIRNAHWFAWPDDRVLAHQYSVYTLIASVVVNGNRYDPQVNWAVGLLNFAGNTTLPKFEGVPDIDGAMVNGAEHWNVIGRGNFARAQPVASINLPMTSQFYNKCAAHEARHVAQLTAGVPGLSVHTLWNADTLYNNTIQYMVGTSKDDLNNKIAEAIDQQDSTDHEAFELQRNAAELDAYNISNRVAPHYFYEDTSVD